MSESISNAYVFTLVVVIIGLCSGVIISSLAFGKTYKIKNRVIEIIEKHDGYDNDTKNDINAFLKSAGYPVITKKENCPTGRSPQALGMSDENSGVTAINTIENYKYCVYQHKTVKGYYYSVVVYMKFDIPLIGDIVKIEIPIYGDSRIIEEF